MNLTKAQMGRIVIVCENTSHKIRGKFGLWSVSGWVNALVSELYLTAHINSLPEVPLPVFGEFETPTDKLTKTLQYEWATARIELEILLGDPNGNWASLGETALKNSNGYRYRRHRLLDLLTDNPGFQLEENYRLGVQLKNMGFGDIRDTDNLAITGSWTQEFVAIQPQPVYVVNNVYGGGGTGTAVPTTPTSNAVLTLNLSSGTSAFIVSGTAITISLSKATASKTYTATWRKDVTQTTLTCELKTDANGSANLTYDSSNFSVLGAGKYSLELTDNSKTITSNEITAVMPSVAVTPTSAYNWAAASISVAISGVSVNTTYTLEFIDATNTVVSGTNSTKTQTADTTTFTFSGTAFTNPGNYKARLTKGSIVVSSNEIVISAAPTFTFTTPRNNVGYFAEDTNFTFRASNLAKSTGFNYYWLKNDTQVASGTATTDANGVWEGSAGCSIFTNAPYGEGNFKLRLVQGVIDITSNAIEIRALKFYRQPNPNEVVYSGASLIIDVSGIPVGATFSYQLFKSGVAQGSPTSQTFVYYLSDYIGHRIRIDTTNVINSYGVSNAYSMRVTYNGKNMDSNVFSIQNSSNSNASSLG